MRVSPILRSARALLAALALVSASFIVAPAQASAVEPVVPHLSCESVEYIDQDGNRRAIAQFGYRNPNSLPVEIPLGEDNIVLQPPIFREGQPTLFQPGTHEGAFTIYYSPDVQPAITWYLQGSTATSRFSDPTIPPCPADVSVTMTAPASVATGSILTYTIVVSNAGPASARQVSLSNNLPYGTQFLSVSTDNGTCTGPAPKTKGGTVHCDLGTITPGSTAGTQSIDVKIIARPNQGVVTNTIQATSSGNPDPNLSNNTATVETVVTKR